MNPTTFSFFQTKKTQPNQDLIENVLSQALKSADPYHLVDTHILLSNADVCIGDRRVNSTKKITLVALGKASLAMAGAAVAKLGTQIQRGVVVCKAFPVQRPDWKNIQVLQGSHPVPDERSLAAGEAVQNCLSGLDEEDLVLVLISGGASALVTRPAMGITLAELQATNQLLLRSGATINEVNAVRKHLEQLKGGGLLRVASPASVEAFLLSDVIGDDSSVIASGPTVADPSTFADVLAILERYHLTGQVPVAVLTRLQNGAAGKLPETVKPDDPILARVNNTIIGSNRLSIEAALETAAKLNIEGTCLSQALTGEASEVALWFLDEARQKAAPSVPSMAIAGGETTVTVHGSGKGGRNLELALATVDRMANDAHGVLVTLATDGEDGPTDAAGAIVTAQTKKQAQALGLDPQEFLQNNDAYTFFDRVGGLIRTGSTGTNVNDLTFYFNFP
jgi:Putative glycerate kinase